MPWDYVSGEWNDDSDAVSPQANDWYDEFLRGLGIDPKTATGTGSNSPSNQEILDMIGASPGFGGLLKSVFGSDFGKIIGGLGLGKLLQSTGIYGGPNVYKGYTGGIPRLTATREMQAIPTDRRPGAGGISYFSPMQYGVTGITPKTAEEFIKPLSALTAAPAPSPAPASAPTPAPAPASASIVKPAYTTDSARNQDLQQEYQRQVALQAVGGNIAPASSDIGQRIQNIYTQLGRWGELAPSAAEISYWAGQNKPIEQIRNDILQSAATFKNDPVYGAVGQTADRLLNQGLVNQVSTAPIPAGVRLYANGGIASLATGGETDDPQKYFRDIYGREGSQQELANVQGKDPNEIKNILTESLAAWNAAHPTGQTASTQGANTQTATTTTAAIPDEIKNFLDYQMAQTPGFLSPAIGYNTVAEYYKAKNIDPYSADMQKFAQEQVNRAKERAAAWNAGDPGVVSAGPRPSYENLAPWANQDWQTETAIRRAAEDAQRVQSYYDDLKMGVSAGPGPAPGTTPAPTRDPLLAGVLGNLDPITALRAANIMQHGSAYYGQQPGDPQAVALAQKLRGLKLPAEVLKKLYPYMYPAPGKAAGGIASLGSYSDGGRLLRGPGDGVSDSIPATIGQKQPARLADGEFVIPARIVSEIGNGSTEAGARKLYQMMDRVQQARSKSLKNVAANTRADKYLPK